MCNRTIFLKSSKNNLNPKTKSNGGPSQKHIFSRYMYDIALEFACQFINTLCKSCPQVQKEGQLSIKTFELALVGVVVIAKILTPVHNVHFGWYVYITTEQAETYLKRCVLINYSTYICLCLFGWKVNLIFKETVTFKL